MASIRKLLPTIVVLQISIAMGDIAWISFIAAKKQIQYLVSQLSWQVTEHIHNEVRAYLQPSKMIHDINKIAILNGDLELNNLNDLGEYFWRQMSKHTIDDELLKELSSEGELDINSDWEEEEELASSVKYILFGSEKGAFIGVENQFQQGKVVLKIKQESSPERITYELNDRGQRIGEVDRQKYDHRLRSWYQEVKQYDGLSWSSIYTSSYDPTSLRITPGMPIYDENGSLVGVLGIEITLRQISDFLSSVNISPGGKAFLIDKSGKLVATSENEILSISTPSGNERLSAIDSSDRVIEGTMEKLLAEFNRIEEITEPKQRRLNINGVKQFIQVKPLEDKNLDWLIIVVIPESDFMNDVYANLRVTILLGIIGLAVAIIVAILTSQWIVRPLGLLNQAAQEIEFEEFNPETLAPVSGRQDELGQLARVFQEMANIIYARKQNFKKQMEALKSEKDKKKKASILIKMSQGSYVKKILKKSQAVRIKNENYYPFNLPEVLKDIKYFKDFSNEDIEELIKVGYKTIIKEGKYIVREEEPGDSFYIIIAGAVEIYVEKIHKFLTNLSAGSCFGELSLLLGIPRTATVRTTEETILFVVDRKGLQKLLQTHQELADPIAAQLNANKAELDERKEMLKKWGLLDENDNTFSENPLAWIRQKMTTRFGV